MQVESAQISRAIEIFVDTVANPPTPRAPIAVREDPAWRRAALEAACAQVGISVDDYHAALASDPSLADLEKQAMTEKVAGSTDPGPHDAISRESPSGQPGDLTKPRTLPRSEAPGGA
jgi:hypothetical protein